MITLRIVVEGATEESFVNDLLGHHLGELGVYATPSCVVTSGSRCGPRQGQGGGRSYDKWRMDILKWIQQEGGRPEVWFTTMLDFYGLSRVRDFPGHAEARLITDAQTKVCAIEKALAADIQFERFIPYVQLHEFESLLLVDPSALKGMFIEEERAIDDLVSEIRETQKAAEDINDGDETAPSKRIIKHLPVYKENKVVAATDATQQIGLPRLIEACPHFGAWVRRLENLGARP